MMPAVIVAAGVASRLRPYSQELPKTLMELEPGLPLIEFILERLRKAGLEPIYVVTRREHAEKLGRGRGVHVLVVDEEEFGNLWTVYTALKHVSPPFLIAMSDHIFEYELLERLLHHRSSEAFTICLDSAPPALEVREGLKVRVEGGRITAVGKALESRYGIDTGLIMVREGALSYIEEAIKRKGLQAAIGDALDLAARAGDVDFVDVTGLLWKDVDTPGDLLEARRLYSRIVLRELEKASFDPVTRLLVRPLSRILALDVPPLLRGEIIVKLAVAEIALAALVVVLAVLEAAAWPLALLALSYAALLLADARRILTELKGGAAIFKALSVTASVFYDAALLMFILLNILALQPTGEFLKTIVPLALLGLASAAGAEVTRFFTASRSRVRVVADRALLLLSSVFTLLAGLYFPALISGLILGLLFLWLASGVAALVGSLTPPTRSARVEVTPRPPIEKYTGPAHRYIEVVVVNSLKLLGVLLVLGLVHAAAGGVSFSLGGEALTVGDLLSTVELLAIIYYGYRVLAGLRGLVDIYAVKLSRLLGITESSARGIAVNFLYLLIAVLALLYVPPLFLKVPEVGVHLSTAVALALLIPALLLFYTLVKELRRTFKGFIDLLVKRIASVVEYES